MYLSMFSLIYGANVYIPGKSILKHSSYKNTHFIQDLFRIL